MTRYDFSVSNFLWIASYADHTRILFFEKYVRILTYFILSYAYPRTLVNSARLFVHTSWDRSSAFNCESKAKEATRTIYLLDT